MEKGSSNGLNCAAFGSYLAGLLDGELRPTDRRRLEDHVQRCSHCAADLARQRATQAILRRMAMTLRPSPALREQVVASLAHEG